MRYEKGTDRREAGAWALIALVTCLFLARQLSAQQGRQICPGLDPSGSEAEHALCWFDNDQHGATVCGSEKQGVNQCISNAVRWCASAAFDAARVANACFMAHIRAGQFREAETVSEYLQSPSKEVEKCREALTEIKARIVSNPSGAEVLVDGHSYGQAPVEVKLTGDWRKSRVMARFVSGGEVIQVVVPPQELVAVFDRRACVMSDLIITGAKPVKTEPPVVSVTPSVTTLVREPRPELVRPSAQEQARAPAEYPPYVEKGKEKAGVSVPGVVLASLGAAGAITGGILLAMAASRKSDLDSSEPGTRWSEVEDDYEGLNPRRIGGSIVLGSGVVVGAIGAVLLLTGSSRENAPETARSEIRLRLGSRLLGRRRRGADRRGRKRTDASEVRALIDANRRSRGPAISLY